VPIPSLLNFISTVTPHSYSFPLWKTDSLVSSLFPFSLAIFLLTYRFFSCIAYSFSTLQLLLSLVIQIIIVLVPSLLYSSISSLFLLCSITHSHPYSLSALELILIPIPSLLYNSFSSLFSLYSKTHSHPSSLSALQLFLIPIPSLL
jgi:hypothetical protein